MEISDEAVLIDSSRLKSVVWKDFDRIKKGDTCVAVCRHCKKKLSGSSTSGTSHLRNHLIRCRKRSNHDIVQLLTKGKKKETTLAISNYSYQERKNELPTLTNTNFEQGPTNDVTVANKHFDNKRSRFDLARMIILHGYPLTMVDHIGFKIFVRNLQPLFELVTFDVVEADCKEIYYKEKQKVCEMFDKLPGKISLSANMWTGNGNTNYLCLTAYCIDDMWQLKKRIFKFITVDLSQTEETLTEVIMMSLIDWNIDRKLFSMTFDSSFPYGYIGCGIRERLSQNRFLLCNGQLFEVRCAANVIKDMVQEALESLSEVVYKIRESIRHVRSSQASQDKFNELVQLVGLDSPKYLSLDNITRWDSTYVMLDVALEYKDAFILLQEHDPNYTTCPSDLDWERASAIAGFLKLFIEVSNVFSGSKHPTANIYFPEICDIHLQLIQWCQNEDDYINTLALKMKTRFDEYWRNCSLALAIAAILDPRFKMKLIEYYYPQIYVENASDCIDIVSNCMKELYHGHDIYSPLASEGHASHDSRDRLTGFDRFLHETSQSQNMKSDLEKYLEEPLFPRNVDFNILNWWKVHTPRYPILSMMARNILPIPMSKVSPETAFDTSDRVLDHSWSLLSSETLDALMCAQDWMLYGLEDLKSSSSTSTLALCYDAK